MVCIINTKRLCGAPSAEDPQSAVKGQWPAQCSLGVWIRPVGFAPR